MATGDAPLSKLQQAPTLRAFGADAAEVLLSGDHPLGRFSSHELMILLQSFGNGVRAGENDVPIRPQGRRAADTS